MNAQDMATLTIAFICLGKLLKSNKYVPDEWIPTILAVAGAVLSMAMSGWTVPIGVEGAGAGLAAVGANQLYRQVTNGKAEKPVEQVK